MLIAKLTEYALALELLEQWESLFTHLSSRVRCSSLIAHQQLAHRVADRVLVWSEHIASPLHTRLHVLLKMGRCDPDMCVQLAAWENIAAIVPLVQTKPNFVLEFLRGFADVYDESSIIVLLACLRSRLPSTRIAAVATLGRLDKVRFNDILTELAHLDLEPVVRQAASRALKI